MFTRAPRRDSLRGYHGKEGSLGQTPLDGERIGVLAPSTNTVVEPEFYMMGVPGVITYCGSAIAASSDAFVLTLFGVDNVARPAGSGHG